MEWAEGEIGEQEAPEHSRPGEGGSFDWSGPKGIGERGALDPLLGNIGEPQASKDASVSDNLYGEIKNLLQYPPWNTVGA